MLRTSGAALAAASGVALAGNAAACPGCGGGGGGGGGPGGNPPSISTGHSSVGSSCDVAAYGFLGSSGDDDSANVWFEYGREGEGLPNDTNIKIMYGPGSFCDGDGCWYDSFGCLDSGTYEYRAVASNSRGKSTGSIRTFTV